MLPPCPPQTRPNARRFAPLLLAGIFVLLTMAAGATQPAPNAAGTPQTAASQPAEPHYWLRVTGDRVNVRSRADANSRIVAHADRDDVLEAVGCEYGWHKIIPPESVFSLVSARYVQRLDAHRGIVKVSTTLRVRVGSDVQPRDPMLSEVQTRLACDAEVRIIGEDDAGWLKIVPPEGVYVYISADFAERIDAELAERLRVARSASQPARTALASRTIPREERQATTQPVEPPALSGPWGQQLKALLDAIESEKREPVDQQLWEDILKSLRPIAAQRAEPQVARLAAAWIDKLERYIQRRAALRQARELARQAELEKARHARELEEIRRTRERLATRPSFDARGVLRPSFALPAGLYGLRYSLQDPFTHEVQAYVEFPPELGIDVPATVGKYVGVQGERQAQAGVSVPLLHVTHITVLNPNGPASRPAREEP